MCRLQSFNQLPAGLMYLQCTYSEPVAETEPTALSASQLYSPTSSSVTPSRRKLRSSSMCTRPSCWRGGGAKLPTERETKCKYARVSTGFFPTRSRFQAKRGQHKKYTSACPSCANAIFARICWFFVCVCVWWMMVLCDGICINLPLARMSSAQRGNECIFRARAHTFDD